MGSTPVFVTTPRTEHRVFVAGHATRQRPLWTPGASGSRIDLISIASSDAGANELQLAIGKAITLAANMGTAAFVDGGGGDDTITRSAGSFVTDGWLVGDRIQLLGATTLANDFLAILTGVAAGTLTFATATVNTAEAFAAATAIYRLGFLARHTVPITAGTIAATPAVSGLSETQMPLNARPNRFMNLGATDKLFGAVTTAVVSPETVDVLVSGWDY